MGLIVHFPFSIDMENRGVDGGILSNNQIGIGTGKTGNGSLNISNARTTTLTLDSLKGLSRNFSIALWVNLSSGSDWNDVFSLGSSASGTFRMECSDGAKTLNLYGNGGYTDNGGAGWWSISNNTWYHFAYVIDNSNMYVYVNGVLQKSRTIYANDSLTGTISFGDSSISCKVNDFRIYNHCLTDVEIKNLYKALVLHYNFEELYKPLEYLESNGTQYINPGVGFVNGSSFAYELKIQFPNTTTSTGSGHHRATIANTNGLLKVGYAQTNFNAREWNTAKVEWSSGNVNTTLNQYSYVNGELVAVNTTEPYDTNPYLLFACCSWGNTTGVPPYSYESVRIGSCKIYRNGTLLRDMIPVIRNIDGRIGMLDRINGTFYTNAGSGEFSFNDCFAPVNYQNAAISGNTVTFSKSSDGWGNSGILAKQPVNKGFVSATVAQNNRYIMIGFAPVNNSYNYTQGYFIYPSNDATFNIYELGAHIGNFGSYTANDVFRVIYDGSKISYYKNTSLVREISVGGKMYMNITNYNAASATIKDVSYGALDFIKDNSGNDHFARLATPTAFSQSTDSKIGEYSLRNISGDYNARINTTLNPSFITNGTIAFWYKKDSSAFNYNSGNFLVATQLTAGSWIGASDGAGLPFNSGSSYQNFYIDGVQRTSGSSNIQDTNWHFYVFTGVNLSAWTSFSMQAHGDNAWLYRGNIADFKIYNSSLSANDIKSLYEARMLIDPKGNIYCEKFINKETNCEFPSKQGVIKAHGFINTPTKIQLNAEYDLLDYIESTNGQYIDTGIRATDTITRLEGYLYKKTAAGTAGILFGLYGGGNDLMYLDYSESGITYHQTAFGYGSYPILYLNSGASNSDGYKRIIYTHNGSSFTYSVNGYSASGTSSAVFSTSYTHYLMAYNAQGSTGYGYSCKMYSFKIWVNNILVRDYIPVRRKSDGAIGLLDKINYVFYTSRNGSSFVAGTNKGTAYLVGGRNIFEGMGVSVNPTTTKK